MLIAYGLDKDGKATLLADSRNINNMMVQTDEH